MDRLERQVSDARQMCDLLDLRIGQCSTGLSEVQSALTGKSNLADSADVERVLEQIVDRLAQLEGYVASQEGERVDAYRSTKSALAELGARLAALPDPKQATDRIQAVRADLDEHQATIGARLGRLQQDVDAAMALAKKIGSEAAAHSTAGSQRMMQAVQALEGKLASLLAPQGPSREDVQHLVQSATTQVRVRLCHYVCLCLHLQKICFYKLSPAPLRCDGSVVTCNCLFYMRS